MKAVVVGGGLGGLALALRLRVRGWEVAVCESGPAVGGKMNCFAARGFRFDTGPSLITMPGIFAELFQQAGERLEEHVALERLDPLAEYVFPDGARIVFPGTAEAWFEAARAVEPRDAGGVRRLHESGRKLFELSQRTFFVRDPRSAPRLRDLGALRSIPLRRAWGNYARTVESQIRNPYLRRIYLRYPTYVGSSPYLCPATLLVIPYIEHEFGGWYARGGLYGIVAAVASLAARRGVEIRTGARVVEIGRAGRRIDGVRLASGERIGADAVAVNADSALTRELLGEAPGPDASPGARSLSGFVLLLGVRGRLEGLRHHTVFFSGDYPAEFDSLFARRAFPADPTVYVNAPSRTDASLAPLGCENLFVMANAPATGAAQWGQEQIEAAADAVYRRLGAGGLPGLRGRAELVETWHPGRFESRYLAPGGAIYGTHSHGWRRAFLRTPNRDPHNRGLFHVGGSAHPGGGTPTVLLSARITAALMDEYAR